MSGMLFDFGAQAPLSIATLPNNSTMFYFHCIFLILFGALSTGLGAPHWMRLTVSNPRTEKKMRLRKSSAPEFTTNDRAR